MKVLYPSAEPRAVYRLPTDPPHTLYVEECGRPDGVPVVFLHGGPGSGSSAEHRRYFDPDFYRVVLFDQRGSGRSTPLGMTERNGVEDLVSDMESIRRELGVMRWLLFGGSWGATLALLYAQMCPGAVLGLLLRGTFLARARDLSWVFGPDGVARIFPQEWRLFCREIPMEGRGDLVEAYYRRVHVAESEHALPWARAWLAWEDCVATWTPPQVRSAQDDIEDAQRLLAKARIETHFARHRYFLGDNQLLRDADRLPEVPITIVHGRRDLVCPMEGACALHRRLSGSRLVVPDAGHLATEPAMVDALVSETDRMRDLLG